jgi:hypothetical protein
LRCTEIGLSQKDIEEMDIGLIYDIMTEKINDNYYEERKEKAPPQEFFDRFAEG